MNHKIFSALIITLVTGTAAYGLWLAGAPSKERARRFDRIRLSDLQQISSAVDQYWMVSSSLPTSLTELKRARGVYVSNITDPETHQPYEYMIKTADSYDVCATFALPSSESDQQSPARYVPMSPPGSDTNAVDFWHHEVGRVCFTPHVNKPPVIKGL